MAEDTAGRFVWYDLMTTGLETALRFYTRLLGWTTRQTDMGEMGKYTMIRAGDREIGGMVPMDAGQGVPSHWIAYVGVPDLEKTVNEVSTLGGSTAVPPTDIPGVGRFAVILDPQGAPISPFQPLPGEASPPPAMGPGTVCWNELLTTDPGSAARFYGSIFGWAANRQEMGTAGSYWIFRAAGQDTAGMMQMPPGAEAGPHWLPYFLVESVDERSERAEELGAKTYVRPTDIPNIGRFSVFADPSGAAFALFQGLAA